MQMNDKVIVNLQNPENYSKDFYETYHNTKGFIIAIEICGFDYEVNIISNLKKGKAIVNFNSSELKPIKNSIRRLN